MNCITSEEAKELAEWNQPGEVRSIYAVLQQLTDRRGKQGKRYSLALILTLLRLPKAAGETTLQAMAEWVRLRSAWLQETLPGIRPTFPCAATYSNVLRAVDPDERECDADVPVNACASRATRQGRTTACGSGWQNLAGNPEASGSLSKEDASGELV